MVVRPIGDNIVRVGRGRRLVVDEWHFALELEGLENEIGAWTLLCDFEKEGKFWVAKSRADYAKLNAYLREFCDAGKDK
jgi:hypothetical protein